MTLLTLSSVSIRFGADPLLSDVSFSVAERERWGIVGRNGTGKTSLFRLIAGAMDPAEGSVTRRPGVRVTVLDQHRDFGEAKTIWEAAASGYRNLLELEEALARESERLGELGVKATQADLQRFGRDQERFLHEGGYEFRSKVDAVLQGLGFDAAEARGRSPQELSGGERGRLGLAGQLAAPADLVLLDEPTNHLDLDTIEWLTSYLRSFDGTVMVISHDRAFLDDLADHVLHLTGGTATPYRGGYSAFATQRKEALLTLTRRVEEQRKEIAREEEFIRRNIAGQKTKQAKSRRTRLARLPRLSPPPEEDEAMAVHFALATRGGDQVLVTEGLSVAVGGTVILEDLSLVARRGDIIAVVGANGVGKTSLLATLLGELPPGAGSARLGSGVTPAWFRQDHAHLPEDRSIYDCVALARPTWDRGRIQGHLGRFGFSGDEVRRKTDSLSGGERARVALALVTLEGANLLALDEPTNHLDVESVEALEDALERYVGTVLLVSHDRALLREITTRVWSLEGGAVRDFSGPFVDWEVDAAERAEARESEKLASARELREAARMERRREAEASRSRQAARRALLREAEAAEEAVHEAEEAVAALEDALARQDLYDGTAESVREAVRLGSELAAARTLLDEAMARWAEAMERADAAE